MGYGHPPSGLFAATMVPCPRHSPIASLPEHFGDWKNTHRRFSRWAKNGMWQSVFEPLATDADNEYAMIDSTIVRAHQHSAGAPKKR